jgi:hypothetical protein
MTEEMVQYGALQEGPGFISAPFVFWQGNLKVE